MFVVIFTHQRPLAEVDLHLQAHFAFLDQVYDEGVYLLSGRREPRNGAVILARAASQEALEAVLQRDPFIENGLARYEIFEFVPGRAATEIAGLLGAS